MLQRQVIVTSHVHQPPGASDSTCVTLPDCGPALCWAWSERCKTGAGWASQSRPVNLHAAKREIHIEMQLIHIEMFHV